MKKELRPFHDNVACDVCGRTILKGERAEPYLVTGGQRKLVCDLCAARATHEGWIRESAHGDLPASRRRPEQRPSRIGRLFGRRGEGTAPESATMPTESQHREDLSEGEAEEAVAAPEEARPRVRDPRHVRAVPTNAEVKIERALELFNGSENPRTIAGVMRSLGEPWVSASADLGTPSEVTIVVAWELSWYRFRVDLGDAGDPVVLSDKGHELSELPDELRAWNGEADEHGRLAVGVGSGR